MSRPCQGVPAESEARECGGGGARLGLFRRHTQVLREAEADEHATLAHFQPLIRENELLGMELRRREVHRVEQFRDLFAAFEVHYNEQKKALLDSMNALYVSCPTPCGERAGLTRTCSFREVEGVEEAYSAAVSDMAEKLMERVERQEVALEDLKGAAMVGLISPCHPHVVAYLPAPPQLFVSKDMLRNAIKSSHDARLECILTTVSCPPAHFLCSSPPPRAFPRRAHLRCPPNPHQRNQSQRRGATRTARGCLRVCWRRKHS